MWRRVLRPGNAAALPEIMAEDVQESKRGVCRVVDRPGSSRPATKQRCRSARGVERQMSIRSFGMRQLGITRA